MKHEVKSFLSFKVEEADESKSMGRIKGFASTFNNIDLGGDRVLPGAFKRTLSQNKGEVMVLADHVFYDQIGWGVFARETDKGLEVEAEIDLENQKGREKYNLAKMASKMEKATMGLSIGYQAVKFDFEEEGEQMIRNLKEVKLFEYSLTAMPMNPEAVITDVKSREDKDILLKQIEEHARKIGLPMSDIADWALAKRPARAEADSNEDVHSVAKALKDVLNTLNI